MAAVPVPAGEDPERAKFYPGDDDLLAEKDEHADHYDVVTADVDADALTGGPG
jgi:hypothetical protein